MGKIVKYKLKKVNDSDSVNKRMAEILRACIADEYDAIRNYESYYETILQAQQAYGKDYNKTLECLQDVINEEKKHVGEFTEMIKNLVPEEYELYQEGQEEVIKIIKVD